jgi:hypothetical protein
MGAVKQLLELLAYDRQSVLFRLHVRWYVHHFLGRSVFRLQVGMYSGTNFAMCVSFVINKLYFHYTPQ